MLSVVFRLVDQADVPFLWALAKEFIARGLRGEHSIEDAEEFVMNGQARLWAAWRGPEMIMALVTEIVDHPKGRLCNIASIGGSDMEEWLHFLATIEEWAKGHGCERMVYRDARPGWQRVLKGYRTTRVMLEKELGNG